MKYCSLFGTFFKVGATTIGGGFAMIPALKYELVHNHGWITEEEFTNYMVVAQSMPGIFIANMATAVGYKLKGTRGAIVALLGCAAAPIIFILLIAAVAHQLNHIAIVEHIFMGLRPVVVALIVVPVFTLARSAHLTWCNCWIPLATLLLIVLCHISPVWIVVAAIAGGFLWGAQRNKRELP
ncbi:MAG: chromate transporter [Bacteroidales bacterium]|nr:chromate transporter [Bacteroidales bacterium]